MLFKSSFVAYHQRSYRITTVNAGSVHACSEWRAAGRVLPLTTVEIDVANDCVRSGALSNLSIRQCSDAV